jgi:hypothetical protein
MTGPFNLVNTGPPGLAPGPTGVVLGPSGQTRPAQPIVGLVSTGEIREKLVGLLRDECTLVREPGERARLLPQVSYDVCAGGEQSERDRLLKGLGCQWARLDYVRPEKRERDRDRGTAYPLDFFAGKIKCLVCSFFVPQAKYFSTVHPSICAHYFFSSLRHLVEVTRYDQDWRVVAGLPLQPSDIRVPRS